MISCTLQLSSSSGRPVWIDVRHPVWNINVIIESTLLWHKYYFWGLSLPECAFHVVLWLWGQALRRRHNNMGWVNSKTASPPERRGSCGHRAHSRYDDGWTQGTRKNRSNAMSNVAVNWYILLLFIVYGDGCHDESHVFRDGPACADEFWDDLDCVFSSWHWSQQKDNMHRMWNSSPTAPLKHAD